MPPAASRVSAPNASTNRRPGRLLASRWEGLACVLAAAAVLSFYGWLAAGNDGFPPARGRYGDFYNLLVHGFVHGHLWMDTPVDPGLAAAANPYDPAVWQRHGGLLDASYYRGHYYLYFGVAPAVVFFLTYRLLTGFDLWLATGTSAVAGLAFLALAALWLRVRRDYFPGRGGPLGAGFTIALLGLGTGAATIVRRPGFYELPIISGLFFTTLMMHALYSAAHRRRAPAWLAAAGVCLGLAVGSRPPLGFAIFGAAALIAGRFRERRRAAGVAFLAGFGAIFAGLLIYNFQRFGNPLEFGFHYQLSVRPQNERHFHFLSASYFPFNFGLYYLSGLKWSRYYPFIATIVPSSRPAGYFLIETVYGLLKWGPAVWFALAAPFAFAMRRAARAPALGAVVGMIGLVYLAPGLFDLFIESSAIRYLVDFVPYLLLLAAVGFLLVERAAPALVRAVWTAAVLVTAGIACLIAIPINSNMIQHRGYAYQDRVIRLFNTPTFWYERLVRNWRYGPVTLQVVFPRNPPGRPETLIETPEASLEVACTKAGVRLGMRYPGESRIAWGKVIPVAAGVPHEIDATFGSLYPIGEHPYYVKHAWLPADRSTVAAAIDGREALRDFRVLDPVDCADIRVAGDRRALDDGFSGRILSVARNSASASGLVHARPIVLGPAPIRPAGVRMRIVFRASPPWALREPVLTTGRAGEFDTLSIVHYGGGAMRFVYQHGTVWPTEGPLLTGVDYRRPHSIEIRTSALADYHGDRAAAPGVLRVTFDGKEALRVRTPLYRAPPQDTTPGRNPFGAYCEPEFVGEILLAGWIAR